MNGNKSDKNEIRSNSDIRNAKNNEINIRINST
jgi:hypothetical protein